MKQLDLTKLSKQGQSSDGLDQIQKFLIDSLAWLGITLESEGQASETVVRQFNRMLDDRYTMLKNVGLPGTPRPVPLILVGPQGVYVMNPRMEAGVFRAREDTWVEMNRRTQEYDVGRINLLEQTLDYAQVVENFLRQKGHSVTRVSPLLIFANPGAHVETSRPIVRILPIDALDRYIVNLAQGDPVIPIEQNMALVESLSAAPEPPPQEEQPQAPKPQPKRGPAPLSQQMNLPPVLANLRLSTRQWTIIGVLAALEILVLIALIVIVVLQS